MMRKGVSTPRLVAAAVDPEVAAWSQVSPWVASAAVPRVRDRGWYSKYRVAMGAADALVLVLTVWATFRLLFRDGVELAGAVHLRYDWIGAILVVVWWLGLAGGSSRDRGVVGVGLEEYRQLVLSSLYVFGGLAIVSYWFHAELSRALFVTTLPIGVLALLIGRWGIRQLLVRLRLSGRAMTRTIAVGTAKAVAAAVRETRRNKNAGYAIEDCCVIDFPEAPELRDLGLRVMPAKAVRQLASSGQYQAVVVTDGLSREESRDLAWSLENRPIELMFVPRVMDVAGPRLSMRSMEGLSLMHVDLPRFAGWKLLVKRAFDLVAAAFALILLAPFMLLIALLIRLDGPGPVFFRQERVGRYGEPFTIHKFRTMCVDAEAKIEELIAAKGSGALLFKLEDDPRITRIGKLLRRYSLDEVPQFWTVLRGGMSVVGPRPQVAREVAEYSEIHHRRLLIKPGITGLWQVNGRSELSMEESIRLDLRYVENWSLIGDLTIIMKTVRVMFRSDGAY